MTIISLLLLMTSTVALFRNS